MNEMTIILTISIIIVSFFLYNWLAKSKNYPPGPFWWPFLGTLPQIGWHLKKVHFHQILEYWTKIYGPILGLRLANQNLVIVSGVRNVKKVLTSSDFDARPDGFFFRMRTFGKRLGVVFSEGSSWRQMRRLVATHLTDENLSFWSEQEVQALIQNLSLSTRNGCIEIEAVQNLFNLPVINTLWTMMVGERLSDEDSRLQRLFDLLNDCFRVVDIGGGTLNYLPSLRHIIPERSGYNLIKRSLDLISEFILETIEQCKIRESTRKNLISDFLLKQNEGKEHFTDEQLISVCLDLFMAGSETTSITISQSILYLLKYPEYQKKIHQELREVCPRPDDWPTWNMRVKLPFIEAFLNEVHRHQSLAPLGIPHRTLKETRFDKYIIPKIMKRRLISDFFQNKKNKKELDSEAGPSETTDCVNSNSEEDNKEIVDFTTEKDTIVAVSLWSVHRDPEFWQNPDIFNPNRFINTNGELIRSSESLLPFGIGKRRCLGESLARVNVFVMLTSLLHVFEIQPLEGATLPSSLGLDGLTLGTHPFSAKFIPRIP